MAGDLQSKLDAEFAGTTTIGGGATIRPNEAPFERPLASIFNSGAAPETSQDPSFKPREFGMV